MNNGSLENTVSEQPINHQHEVVEQFPQPQALNGQDAAHVNGESYSENQAIENGDPEHENNGNDAPPNKKRKLTDATIAKASEQRRISPPWKKITVEGPTSFVEEGRRKSSRTNFVPIELQPQADKRRTRGAIHNDSPLTKSKYGGAFKNSPLTTSASTQTQTQHHAKRSLSAAKSTNTGSPSKSGPNSTVPSQTSSDAPPPPPKRSHKKKFRPISPIPDQPSSEPHHQPRRIHRRKSEITTDLRQETGLIPNGWHHEEPTQEEEIEDKSIISPGRRPQRVNLKVRMPTVHIQHPENLLLPRKYESFKEWFEKEGRLGLALDDTDPNLTDKEAVREAQLRLRMVDATQAGGLLSEERCQFYKPEAFEPPDRCYTHQDRLVTHAVYFQKLMEQERRKHRRNAKEYAEKAAAAVREKKERTYREWKQAQPKTEEDIAQEQEDVARAVYQQVQEDIKHKWLMIAEKVEASRMQRWQEEQDRLGKVALNEAIERSKGLLNRRRPGGDSQSHSEDEVEDQDEAGGDEGSSSSNDEDSQRESNMSASESEESEEDQAVGDDDEGLTQEQLRKKYSLQPEVEQALSSSPEEESGGPTEIIINDSNQQIQQDNPSPTTTAQDATQSLKDKAEEKIFSHVTLEEVDDKLMDDSDESTDMDDSDMSDDHQSSDEDSDEDEDEDERGPSDLLGFLGRSEVQAARNVEEIPDDSLMPMDEEQDEDEAEEVSLIPDAVQAPTPTATPEAANDETKIHADKALSTPVLGDANDVETCLKENVAASTPAIEKSSEKQGSPSPNLKSLVEDVSLPSTPVSTNPIKTSVPSLLRGTLREYQHFGLDWLAGLYATRTNGILADEMGLGKTIQTIALLAHLALEHEVWGPHLIVVPTSVMLNWEIEFKKFLPGFKVLTYYGTQEERRVKRQGWMDDNKWNVWITSYTIVTKDQQVFKRKAWHYMILDEAHNIKNFQSMRWQTLLTFNTKARLLLTGTPLQNNLTELWSLLFFLTPAEQTQSGISGFADLHEFTDWFRKPVEQIMEHGRDTMDAEARDVISKLHKVLRPFLLRRLKADVEKQMPGKYEHVVYCKLSKRQRYLYDGFMSRAQTRETLASGNTFSIMNALMQLRKVCNHPDLFETRQIVTSFAMPKSAVADFEIKELLVRRRLLQPDPFHTVDLNMINLMPGANEQFSALDTIQRQRIGALGTLRQRMSQQWGRFDHDKPFDGTSLNSALASYENTARHARYEKLSQAQYLTSLRSQRRPLYSHSLMEQIRSKFALKNLPHQPLPRSRAQLSDWLSRLSPAMSDMVLTLPERASSLQTSISKFGCVTPSVITTDMAPLTLCHKGIEVVEAAKQLCPPDDPYHEARMRLSIAFPDKRLLQYDCGKLQRLDTLLRTLQAGGHRALIFTQMTRVLDILEQFLNIHGHRYLRLDGATKIEQRQVLTDRFNNDDRILAFILSSRSGGIGINLTGADTVIFYDLDWNPAMDKQCQDRSHRIGQTRDVHIYRLVSEYTIEANILRKANQKRLLDDVVIQEGEFTTDYFNNMSVKDIVGDEAFDDSNVEANAAMDRVLGGRGSGRVFEAVEDQEDVAAARAAEKELAQNQDAADFDDKGGASSADAATPKTPGPPTPGEMMPPPRRQVGDVELTTTMEAAESGLVSGAKISEVFEEIDELPSCDEYMLRFWEWELKDVPIEGPSDKNKKKSKKGKEHGIRKR